MLRRKNNNSRIYKYGNLVLLTPTANCHEVRAEQRLLYCLRRLLYHKKSGLSSII